MVKLIDHNLSILKNWFEYDTWYGFNSYLSVQQYTLNEQQLLFYLLIFFGFIFGD